VTWYGRDFALGPTTAPTAVKIFSTKFRTALRVLPNPGQPTSVHHYCVDQSPVDQEFVDQLPVYQNPVYQPSVDQASVDQILANQTPVDQTSVRLSTVDQIPVIRTPVDQSAVDQTLVYQATIHQDPVVETSPLDHPPSLVNLQTRGYDPADVGNQHACLLPARVEDRPLLTVTSVPTQTADQNVSLGISAHLTVESCSTKDHVNSTFGRTTITAVTEAEVECHSRTV